MEQEQEQVFCEAAAEWDHLWHEGTDGVTKCRECGMVAGS